MVERENGQDSESDCSSSGFEPRQGSNSEALDNEDELPADDTVGGDW